MEKRVINPKSLEFLRSRLEHGDVMRIARRLGLSRACVSKTLRGEIRNYNVIIEALKLVEENNKKYNELNDKFSAMGCDQEG